MCACDLRSVCECDGVKAEERRETPPSLQLQWKKKVALRSLGEAYIYGFLLYLKGCRIGKTRDLIQRLLNGFFLAPSMSFPWDKETIDVCAVIPPFASFSSPDVRVM